MELIQPAEISGKIMTLIDQAREVIIIVSPYNKFKYWKKLTQRIEKAKKRGVQIIWYIRQDIENNVNQIKEIGINPIEVENLHCKLYLNEKHAVVTSMNLHEYSDSSSIDIGYLITERSKYDELVQFIDIYIKDRNQLKELQKQVITVENIERSFFEDLVNYLISKGYDKNYIKTKSNRYGKIVTIENFLENYDFIIEPKGSYLRLDFRINLPYRHKREIYDLLKERSEEINKSIGHWVAFGSQMKRLKLDLENFEHYDYEKWGENEFNYLTSVLTIVLDTYKTEINNVVQRQS